MAGASKRRRPDAPGLAGLSEQDRDHWIVGNRTAVEIAGRLGVSKQALGKEFRRRGWHKSAPAVAATKQPIAAVPSTSGPPSGPAVAGPPSPLSPIPDTIEGLRRRVEFMLGHADLVLLELTARELDRAHANPLESYGPAALKATATALETIRSNLSAGGLLDAAESKPVEMVIRVMTPDEEDAAQQAAEGALSPRDHERAEGTTEQAAQSEPQPGGNVASGSTFLDVPLPTAMNLRGWLLGLGQRAGAVTLRRIIRELTGVEPGRGASPVELADRIFGLLKGDPERLRAFVRE